MTHTINKTALNVQVKMGLNNLFKTAANDSSVIVVPSFGMRNGLASAYEKAYKAKSKGMGVSVTRKEGTVTVTRYYNNATLIIEVL